ncbi:MAG: hypothetical protein ABIR79_24320 [Candidatus Binatia bacterium]
MRLSPRQFIVLAAVTRFGDRGTSSTAIRDRIHEEFRTWLSDSGLLLVLGELRQLGLIAREPEDGDGIVYRCTAIGRLRLLGHTL